MLDAAVPTENNFISQMYPEISGWLRRINLRSHKVSLLGESEKILRKIRLLFLKFDGLTHRLIDRVRKSTVHNEALLVAEEKNHEEKPSAIMPIADNAVLTLKQEEQRLIIEIAKDPKNSLLYRMLGDIYVKTKEIDDAIQSYKKAIELEPTDQSSLDKLEKLEKDRTIVDESVK